MEKVTLSNIRNKVDLTSPDGEMYKYDRKHFD